MIHYTYMLTGLASQTYRRLPRWQDEAHNYKINRELLEEVDVCPIHQESLCLACQGLSVLV